MVLRFLYILCSTTGKNVIFLNRVFEIEKVIEIFYKYRNFSKLMFFDVVKKKLPKFLGYGDSSWQAFSCGSTRFPGSQTRFPWLLNKSLILITVKY
jgi:hypothetical protein